MRGTCLLSALAVVATPCLAQVPTDRQNWFDDPFFQISASVADCPLPAGPFVTEAERRLEAHHRAERGTTCWLAGQCDRPNSYAYDHDIALAFRKALAERDALSNSSLWITVQGRVVYIEGCVTRDAMAVELEALARTLPNVQQAIAIVRTDPTARPPYKLRSDR
jgi:hypothetical protein